MSLCQLSSMEDDTRVYQGAIDECSVSISLAPRSHIQTMDMIMINSRSNDRPKEVHQVLHTSQDNKEQSHDFDEEGDCSKDTECNLHGEHR
jgi:hypothetical protein